MGDNLQYILQTKIFLQESNSASMALWFHTDPWPIQSVLWLLCTKAGAPGCPGHLDKLESFYINQPLLLNGDVYCVIIDQSHVAWIFQVWKGSVQLLWD